MKPTIIFLHGGPGFRDYLQPFFETLSNRFTCIFYDQIRGPNVTIQDLLSQLHEIVQSKSGERILLGHSWGGVLAIEYAYRHPHLLNGLVLMSTGLTHVHWREEYRKERERLGLIASKPENIFLAPHEQEEGLPFLANVELTFCEETFDQLDRTYLSAYDLTSAFASIRLPIVNIYGDKDIRFPPRVAKAFKNANSSVLEFELPNVGHFPFLSLEGRREVFRILETSFLLKAD